MVACATRNVVTGSVTQIDSLYSLYMLFHVVMQ